VFPTPTDSPTDSPIGARRVAPTRPLLWPLVAATVLVLAVFLAPFPLASVWPGGGYPSRAALVDSLHTGFVHQLTADAGRLGPDLARPVGFWARFHVVKAALAALLLLVLVPLGSRTWTAYPRAESPRRRLVVGALLGVEAPTVFVAILILMANVQQAVAPLSSALGLLPIDRPDPVLAGTINQVRRGLRSGARSPALDLLLHDFVVYHVVMACLAPVVASGLVVAAVLLWRARSRRSGARRRGRGVLTLALVAVGLSCAFFAVLTVANVSVSARPGPALLAFFEGGQ